MTQKARQLTAEVISIGDEMTSGARLDTNAQWLSRRLGELGINVTFHSRAPFPSKLHALQTAGLRLNLLYLHRQERLLHEQVRKKGGEDELGDIAESSPTTG